MKVEWDFSELYEFADNLNDLSKFEREIKFAAKEISAVLLKMMKEFTPVDKSWQLINGWNGNSFLVKQVKGGFEVEIVNTTEYARAVNDGHKAYNQYGGAYKIKEFNPKGAWGKPEGRIKVTKAYSWQKGNPTYYVFGHFFVERGILKLSTTKQVEDIIMKKLQKWWDSI